MNDLATLDRVDEIMQTSLEHDDPDIALRSIQQLVEAERLIGKVKAKFIYLMYLNWDQFSISEYETFNDYITIGMSIDPYTRDRYIRYSQYQKQLPEKFADRPLEHIIPVTDALARGYEFEDDDWDEIEHTHNRAGVDAVVRRIKGTPPRKNAKIYHLYPNGEWIMWRNNQRKQVGLLNLGDPEIDDVIEQIVQKFGVIRK